MELPMLSLKVSTANSWLSNEESVAIAIDRTSKLQSLSTVGA
jgi:hypothetical protein